MDWSSLLPRAHAFAFWAPVLWFVPLFGGRHLPAPVRVVLAIFLGGLTGLPGLPVSHTPMSDPMLGTLLHGLGGLVTGLILRLPFDLVRGVGSTAAASRGTPGSWAALTPTGDRAPPLAIALELALLASATHWALDHRVLRIATLMARSLPGLEEDLVVGLGGWFLATLVTLALPFLVATLLLDLGLGVVGRFLPQLPLFFVGQPLKALLIALLLAATALPILHAGADAVDTLGNLLTGGLGT